MSLHYQTYDTEDFFSDDHGVIGGNANVDVSGVRTMDGHCLYASLIDVEIGGLKLTRDQMCAAFSEDMVCAFEERVVEREHEMAA